MNFLKTLAVAVLVPPTLVVVALVCVILVIGGGAVSYVAWLFGMPAVVVNTNGERRKYRWTKRIA